jgi:single-strand DNA-binding protein
MANFNFNKVMMGGRITADPELKQTQSGIAVCTFSIAVNRKVKQGDEQKADFFNVTAWRGTAEFVSKYFRKGSSIFVVGTIQNRSWTDQNGQKRYATDINADEVSFVDGKNDAQGANDGGGAYIPDAYKTGADANYEEVSGSDDLPF